MDRFRLAEWMRHPEEMEYEELQELESLVERYPYFQVVRMLYLKALYVQKSLRFPRELAKGTVHITDRKQLLRYLNLQEEDFYAVPAEPVRVPEAETPVAPPVMPEPVAAPAPVRKTVARTLDLNLDEEDEPLTAEMPRRRTEKPREELIEDFIRSGKKMPKLTDMPTDMRDLSKENPYPKEELFSETLAKIYMRQKLYDKAIATYQKLSLKYPEKSIYFANRIQEIRANINNLK